MIDLKYVNYSAGKKWGSVKTTTGDKYMFKAVMAAALMGKENTTIDATIIPPDGWMEGAAGQISALAGVVPSATPNMPVQAPQGVPQAQVAPAPTQDHKAEEIFVTGIVGRAMGSGIFNLSDIAPLAKAAGIAWRDRNHTPTATIPVDAPLDDEIPY